MRTTANGGVAKRVLRLSGLTALMGVVGTGCAAEVDTSESEAVGETSQAFSESTCASNPDTEDASYAFNPTACGYTYYTSDSGDATYGHDDCVAGWITEFTSTSGDAMTVTEPVWVGTALNSSNCALASKYVYVWGHTIFGWIQLTKSLYQGSWNGSSCVWIQNNTNGFGAPFSTASCVYDKVRTVNNAAVFLTLQRARQVVRGGSGPC